MFVIGPDDTAEAKQIEVGDQIAGSWVVRRGLEPGDRIVVDGWHKIRPGQRVAPVEQQNEKP
ncbi:Multidrug resistance protein MdtE precursor [compost metagenome]